MCLFCLNQVSDCSIKKCGNRILPMTTGINPYFKRPAKWSCQFEFVNNLLFGTQLAVWKAQGVSQSNYAAYHMPQEKKENNKKKK